MLEFGAQGNVFKNVTKRLCTIYWTIKSLTLSGKNTETGYQNLSDILSDNLSDILSLKCHISQNKMKKAK